MNRRKKKRPHSKRPKPKGKLTIEKREPKFPRAVWVSIDGDGEAWGVSNRQFDTHDDVGCRKYLLAPKPASKKRARGRR